MMKDIVKLGLILAAFAAAACVGLAFVNQATEKQIEANLQAQLNESLQSLFAGADGFEDATAKIEWSSTAAKLESAYLVTKAGEVVGAAIKGSGPSYGGTTVVLVGVSPDQKIVGVKVLENKDTPGLGANAAVPTYFVDKSKKTTWPGQFAGKALSDKFVVKEDVAVITASTITSKALTTIIKASGDAAGAYLKGLAPGVAK